MRDIRVSKLVINCCVGESGDRLQKAAKVGCFGPGALTFLADLSWAPGSGRIPHEEVTQAVSSPLELAK